MIHIKMTIHHEKRWKDINKSLASAAFLSIGLNINHWYHKHLFTPYNSNIIPYRHSSAIITTTICYILIIIKKQTMVIKKQQLILSVGIYVHNLNNSSPSLIYIYISVAFKHKLHRKVVLRSQLLRYIALTTPYLVQLSCRMCQLIMFLNQYYYSSNWLFK